VQYIDRRDQRATLQVLSVYRDRGDGT